MRSLKEVFYILTALCVYNSNWAAMPGPSKAYVKDVYPICTTNVHIKGAAVSLGCRHLFYKALQDCGHDSPEQIVVENGERTQVEMFPFNNQWNCKIIYNESYWKQFPIGVCRIVAYHEAMHVMKKLHHNSIDDEREADRDALTISNCRSCTIESAKWHFEKSSLDAENEYISFEEVQKKTDKSLQVLLDDTRIRSSMRYSTHPLHAERGLAAYLRLKEMSNARCEYHLPLEVKQI